MSRARKPAVISTQSVWHSYPSTRATESRASLRQTLVTCVVHLQVCSFYLALAVLIFIEGTTPPRGASMPFSTSLQLTLSVTKEKKKRRE